VRPIVGLAAAVAALGACSDTSPGLDLHITLPSRALGSAAQLVVTAVTPDGSPLGMGDSVGTHVTVHADDGKHVTITLGSGFTFSASFDLLLVPTTATPVTVNLSGKLFDANQQLLATARVPMATPVVANQRTSASLVFTCKNPDCSPAPAGPSIDLAAPPTTPLVVTVSGTAASDRLQVLTVGRFSSGNPRGDLVLAAPGKNATVGGRTYVSAGEVYVFRGRDWTVPANSNYSADSDADLVIVGREDDLLGSAAAVGDFDGDGADDLAIAALGAARPGTPPSGGSYSAAGAVYVITARRMNALPATMRTIDLNDPATLAATPRIYGSNGQEQLGAAIALGHVSSAMSLDLMIGAPGADGNAGLSRAGRIYVVAGFDPTVVAQSALAIQTAASGGMQWATVFGGVSGAPIGKAIAAADLDGDGKADLAIGNFLDQGGRGTIKLVAGAHLGSGATFDLAMQMADAGFVGASGNQIGWAVALADVTGSGARWLCATSRAQSLAYLFPAALDGSLTDVSMGQFGLGLAGPGGSGFGSSLTSGNLDGDAAADLVIGAPSLPGPDGMRAMAGAAYVVTGAQIGSFTPSTTVNVATSAPALVVYGAASGDALGAHVAAGNFDISSPTDEVVVGADNGGMSQQGVAYAIQNLSGP
jgi:hypothetical protein